MFDPAKRCEACQYYQAAKPVPAGVHDTRGMCRRYPAAVPKLPHDACGEFRAPVTAKPPAAKGKKK